MYSTADFEFKTPSKHSGIKERLLKLLLLLTTEWVIAKIEEQVALVLEITRHYPFLHCFSLENRESQQSSPIMG